MYKLPSSSELYGLIGSEVTQVCFGSTDIVINFHNGNYISCSGSVEVNDIQWGQAGFTDRVVKLNGNEIIDIISSGKTITLKIGAYDLKLRDDSDEYESFTILSGKDKFVV